MKKLYRSKTNKIFSGVLGGVGEYLNIDPVIARLVFVLLLFVSGVWPMIIVYVIGYFVIPEQKTSNSKKKTEEKKNKEDEPRIHDV